jgi:6-phosphogluconolactonase
MRAAMYVYLGSYTRSGPGEGISLFRQDPSSGDLSPALAVTPTDNPSFLALHPSRPLLYAVHETPPGEGPGPGVSAFAIDPATGHLSLLNRQPSHGTSPCYVSLDPAGQHVLVANYGDGTLAVFPVGQDGSLGEATDVVQHRGSGSHPRRQQNPHAHSVQFDPGGRFVLACDLGIDRVLVYGLDPQTGRLTPNDPPSASTSPGGGPRHLAFHPDGRFVYVNDEITSALDVFAYDPQRGALDLLQNASTLPPDFTAHNSTAQVKVHPSGRHVFVSNRGHDSIARFSIDATTGKVTPLGHVPTQGRTPRNFNLDPTGAFLYAANENGDSVVTFRVDAASGSLTPTGNVTRTPAPVCVLFADL